uniref:Uncharacterized protein n=1 Tax=viral metagenome TaxID=1070528 RepID=A0A6M3JSI4_9ZZZZ
MTELEMKERFRLLLAPFIKRNPDSYSELIGSLILPAWEPWGLAIPIYAGEKQSYEDIYRLVFLQDMVAGILRNNPQKAKSYRNGELAYFEIVEEVENFVGRRLTMEPARKAG